MSAKPSLKMSNLRSSLESLDENSYSVGDFVSVSLEDVDVNPQVRKVFSEDAIKGLAKTIERQGQRKPVEVYQESGRFILVSGERRFRALKHLKRSVVQVKIIAKPEPAELIYLQVTENTEHEPLSVIELALAVFNLFDAGEKGQRIASVLNLTGRDQATRLRKIGAASSMVHALFDEHGIADQRLLYLAAQLEEKHSEKFSELYPQIADRTLGRAEIDSWLSHLKQTADAESGGQSSVTVSRGEEASKTSEQPLPESGRSGTLEDRYPSNSTADPAISKGSQEVSGGEGEEAPRSGPESAPEGFEGEIPTNASPSSAGASERQLEQPSPAPATTPTHDLMALHLDASSQVQVEADGLCIEVKTKLPNGTVINGTIARTVVDKDSSYVWIQPDDAKAPMIKAESKKVKILTVTSL